MALDSAQWIAELSVADPQPDDPVGQGDDHMRTIKTVLDNTFVGNVGANDVWDSVNGPLLVGPTELNTYPARLLKLDGQMAGAVPITGPLNLANDNPVNGRNFADSADISLIKLNASDEVVVAAGALTFSATGDASFTGDMQLTDSAASITLGGASVIKQDLVAGFVIQGSGLFNDITLRNNAAEDVLHIAAGSRDVIIDAGNLDVLSGNLSVGGGFVGVRTNTQAMEFSGSSAPNLGANLVLYGSSHATRMNELEFRIGSTPIFDWDDPAELFSFLQGRVAIADLAGTGTRNVVVDANGLMSAP